MIKVFLLSFFYSISVFAQNYSFECTTSHVDQMNMMPTNPKGCRWECVKNQPTLLKQVCSQIQEDLNCEETVYTNKNVDRVLVLNLSQDPSQRSFEVTTSGVLNGGQFKNSKYECELKKLDWDGEKTPVICEDYTVDCKINGRDYDCEDLKEVQSKMNCHPSFMEY